MTMQTLSLEIEDRVQVRLQLGTSPKKSVPSGGIEELRCVLLQLFSATHTRITREECCINAWNVPEYCSKVPPAQALVLLWYAENQLHLVL